MQTIQPVIKHITDVYGFSTAPCLIPRSGFQYAKRNFYIFIKKRNEKLFNFLIKLFPIRFLDERPDGEIWLQKRLDGGLCEIEIKPVPVEASIYTTDTKGIFTPTHTGNYRVRIYYDLHLPSPHPDKTFPLNSINGDKQIDAHFSDIPELNSILRDYKIKKILK